MADEVAKTFADLDRGLGETADDIERAPASGSTHPVRMPQTLDGEAVGQSATAAPEAERASASGSIHPVRTSQVLDGGPLTMGLQVFPQQTPRWKPRWKRKAPAALGLQAFPQQTPHIPRRGVCLTMP